jgi:phytoene desaturase
VFDLGPTFLMMKFILDEMFEETGKDINKYLSFTQLEPMYHLAFSDKTFTPGTDHAATRKQIAALFPGNEGGYDRFLKHERQRFLKLYPCIQKPYGNLTTYVHPTLLKAIPYLALGKALFDNLGNYFNDEKLKIAFTFQAKYLGMSPWNCPAFFTIIPYIEHGFGVHHVRGGLSEISRAMAKAAQEEGAVIRTNTPVQNLLLDGKKVTGVQLTDGTKVEADEVIINADFAYAMSRLAGNDTLKKYSPGRLSGKEYSCSTFMLYLGVDKIYNEPHHKIIFAHDYKANIHDITDRKIASEDMSVYVRNASVTDPTLAPAGKSAIYVLVPAPNNLSAINWQARAKEYRDKVLGVIQSRTSMKDLDRHIEVEKIITPHDWEHEYHVYRGATFNLAHTWPQLLYFRPHNRFEELDNCYLAGGGTHPGSGLPTIYESGRITSNLISAKYRIPFRKPPGIGDGGR